jgi:hypothetical protein
LRPIMQMAGMSIARRAANNHERRSGNCSGVPVNRISRASSTVRQMCDDLTQK